MSSSAGASVPAEARENFEAIEQAVMETPRGRWFLEEFARRQRSRELNGILAAMERLERALAASREAQGQAAGSASRIAATGQPAQAPAAADQPLEARQLRYFRKDEEIFAPGPPIGPVPVPDSAAVPPAPAAAPFAMPPAADEATPRRRIVIIRHKAGEEIDVPLQRELAESA